MLPVLYIEDNRLFDTKGNAFAVFKIESQPYAFQTETRRVQVIERVIRTISSNVVGDMWFFLLTKQWSIDQTMKRMGEISKHNIWEAHREDVRDLLKYNLPFSRVNLIVVPIALRKLNIEFEGFDWKDWFKQLWFGVKDVKDKFVQNQESIPVERLEKARREAEEWKNKLSQFGGVTKAKLEDIEWWLKRSFYRGLEEPKNILPSELPFQVITQGGREHLRPARNVFLTLSNVIGKERPTQMVFTHEDDSVSYQTFFASSGILSQPIPERNPIGYEWLYGVLEQASFPVDCAIHMKVVPPHQALDNVRSKKKTAEQQFNEWDEAGEEIPLEMERDLATVSQLEEKLRSQNPLVFVKVIFGIGADEQDKLKQYTQDFKNLASNYHLVVQAVGDMKRMFTAFYPFGDILPNTWDTPMDAGVFGAGVPFGTRELGDPFGFWLGRLSTGRTVYIDPRRPAQELNSTNAIMIVGTLGSGKTYLMKYLDTMLLTWGAKGFHIDPKGDTQRMTELPFKTKVLDFTTDSTTQFSPFRIGNMQDAQAIIDILLNSKNDETRNVLLNIATEKVIQSGKWDMESFYTALREMYEQETDEKKKSEIDLIAERVRLMRTHELGRKFFGKDGGDEFNYNNIDFIIAVTRGLPLPDKNIPKEKWTENQMYASALMYAVATLGLRKLMSLPKHILKFLAIDESWVLKLFAQGERLLNDALRFSRSENLIPIIASQNATDFLPNENNADEDITNLFAWKFMLHLESEIQVGAALKILGMTDSEPKDWVGRFNRYNNGRGLVRDPEGRIGEMQVDIIPHELDEYFNSTPREKVKPEDKESESA